MSQRKVDFSGHDEPLRRDVSRLGKLLGEVIKDQCDVELYDHVERVRKAAITRREAEDPCLDDLRANLGEVDLERLAALVRAFTAYFQVVNLAERVHRVRRTRQVECEPGHVPSDSLQDIVKRLHKAGVDYDTLIANLGAMTLEPVFTAHPTEATRRSLLEKEQVIVRLLLRMLDESLPPRERAVSMEQIRSAITSAWQTRLHSEERPRVEDEMEHVLFYLTDVLYRVVPTYYEALRAALAETYGEGADNLRMPVILRFGSWVGGDMDGNPNVGADTLRAALAEHRRLVMNCYLGDVRHLARELSQSLGEVEVSDAVVHRYERYAQKLPDDASRIPPRHLEMPYRCLLALMAVRLEHTLDGGDFPYINGAEFANDLQLIRASLEAHRGIHAGLASVRRLQQRARTFGFHLASLDVRQDALLHREVVAGILDDKEWMERSAAHRTETLAHILRDRMALKYTSTPDIERTLDVFRAMGEGRKRYGNAAVGVFIISMTQDADDVLSVLLLAREAGLESKKDGIPLHVTPLFETADDLTAAPQVLRRLFEIEPYHAHLKARGGRQLVMIGYSDSNKDAGIAAARWGIRRAQEEMLSVARDHDIEIGFFHGRGGSVSRGGGDSRRGILGTPEGAVGGYLRVTEQGEVINQKYALRELALRNLEQTTSAMLEADLIATRRGPESRQAAIMEGIATRSRRAYRELVEAPAFFPYFRQATPIDAIEHMAIGSRPAKRREGKGVEDLRAIPWVFAWGQTRVGLPGTYGVGTALAWAGEEYGEAALKRMLEWPFFHGMINDVEMVLAKSDLTIGEAYADLADADTRSTFGRIREELELARTWVCRLKDSDELLVDQPVLRRAIALRNPYVDPMNLAQIDLLRRWRESKRQDDEVRDALFITINGIAQGLQNTG